MANNCDELEGIHGRLGKAVASAQNGMQAAIRQAGELGDDTPGSPAQTLLWTLQKARQEIEAIDAVHNDFDYALMNRGRTPANDAT